MKRLVIASICVFFLCTGAISHAAESFPKEEPINYLIPFSPGGESDIFARAQQPYLEKALGQKVLVSYKVGAGGAIAWSELANSEPSGYYMAGFNIPHIILQPLQRKDAGYQTSDINPVMIFQITPCVLAVTADSPYKTLEDFVRAEIERPGSITIGGVDSATSGHIATVLMGKKASAKFSYIPFPGTADLPPALLGKHVTAIMAFTTTATQYSKDMRVLAVASDERHPNIDAPTFKELGYDIVEGSIRGLAVPPNTPDAVVQKLYEECSKINADQEFVKKMEEMGFSLLDMNPEQSREFINKRIEEYKTILSELKK